MWGAGQTVEIGAVHRLPDSDPATSSTCHRIPSNPTTDRKAAGLLGGRPPQDDYGRHITATHREEYEEHMAQTFHSLVLRGKLRTAVRWITDRDKGGVL